LDLSKNPNEDCDMKDLTHYKFLAEMFRYPTKDLKSYTGKWRAIIQVYDPGLILKLDPFIAQISEMPLSFQQEYFISTFDVQAMCFLDIGYVLFGEDYKRGVFLVNIKKEQIKALNDCGSELPDHLPNILTLIPKIQDPELAEELIFSLLIPAIHEMIFKFRNGSNLYRGLLEILVTIMEADYPYSAFDKFDFGGRNKTGLTDSFPQEKRIAD
jgi:nitrate reductase assembly molybdenum cofactor insertion protein NarJ